MMKMTRTVQLVLAIAMVASSAANAQLKLKMKSKSVDPDTAALAEPATVATAAALAEPAAIAMIANLTEPAPLAEALAQPGAVPAAPPQVKDDLFAGAEKFAKDASEVTEVNLDPSTMGMVSHGGRDATLAQKMNFMVIHTYKYEKPGMYNMDDFEAYRKKLEDGSWTCSVRVRSKTASTDICSRVAADHETNEMVILTAAPRELTFIHMSGKMSLSDLNRLGDTHGVVNTH
jgi:Domain of unknown function (DUF4252)